MRCKEWFLVVYGAVLIILGLILLGSILIKMSEVSTDYSLPTDYERTILVDDSSKIEQALENAKTDVQSRNFVITNVDVKKDKADSKYSVTVKGIDKGNLISY